MRSDFDPEIRERLTRPAIQALSRAEKAVSRFLRWRMIYSSLIDIRSGIAWWAIGLFYGNIEPKQLRLELAMLVYQKLQHRSQSKVHWLIAAIADWTVIDAPVLSPVTYWMNPRYRERLDANRFTLKNIGTVIPYLEIADDADQQDSKEMSQ